MALIISVAKLLQRYNINDSIEIDSFAVSAIQSATLQLEDVIRTSFTRTTVFDQFWVNSNERPFTGEFPKLFLKNGFVDLTQTFEIRAATELQFLAAETPIDVVYIKTEAEKGLILITGSDKISPPITPFILSDRTFVQVDYTYGFETDSTEFGSVYKDIPEWLHELGLQISFWVYRDLVNCNSGKSKGFKISSMMSMLDRHIRFFPSALPALI